MGMSVLCVPSFLASFDSVEAVAKNFVVRIRYWVVLNSFLTKVRGRWFLVIRFSICVRKYPPICGYNSGCSGSQHQDSKRNPFFVDWSFCLLRHNGLPRSIGFCEMDLTKLSIVVFLCNVKWKCAKVCKYVDFVICSLNKIANMCCKTDKMEKIHIAFCANMC